MVLESTTCYYISVIGIFVYYETSFVDMFISSNIKASFPYDLQMVWEIVTSLTVYSWRSNIEKIEVVSNTQFVEITKGGHRTNFTVIKQVPCQLWEFEMENKTIKGHWIGLFFGDEKNTMIDFTEHIETKKWFPILLVKLYLKIQQIIYVRDLRRVLKVHNHRNQLGS